MNKLLIVLVSLAASACALAQGTVNVNNNYKPTGSADKAFVLGLDGLPLATALGRVEIRTSLGDIVSPVKDGTGDLFAGPGLFLLGTTTFPNIGIGGSGTMQILAWDSSTGSTFATATSRVSSIVSK
jgi:hypothetical protein